MYSKPIPPVDYLKECLEIDLSSPTALKWRERPLNHFKKESIWRTFLTCFSNNPAGTVNKKMNYCFITIDRKSYLVHRIVYALHNNTTDFNDKVVDHINRNSLDNRPENLRLVSQAENLKNKSNLNSIIKNDLKNQTWNIHTVNENQEKIFMSFDCKDDAERALREFSITRDKNLSPYYNGPEIGYTERINSPFLKPTYKRYKEGEDTKPTDDRGHTKNVRKIIQELPTVVDEKNPLPFMYPSPSVVKAIENSKLTDLHLPGVYGFISFLFFVKKLNDSWNGNEYDFYSVHSEIRNFFGWDKQEQWVLNLLVDLKILEMDNKYKVNFYSYGYKFGPLFKDMMWGEGDAEEFLRSLRLKPRAYINSKIKVWNKLAIYFRAAECLPTNKKEIFSQVLGFNPGDFLKNTLSPSVNQDI